MSTLVTRACENRLYEAAPKAAAPPIASPFRAAKPALGPFRPRLSLEFRASPLLRYALAILAVEIAMLVRVPLDPALGDRTRFAMFLAAAVVSAGLCGWRSGLLALVLGIFAGDYLYTFSDPIFGPLAPRPGGFYLVYFAVGGAAICLIEAQRIARHRTESALRRVRAEIVERQAAEAERRQLVVELEAERARLADSEERYRSLFEQNPDAVFTLDLQGRFMTFNPAALKLCGYSPDEVRNLSFTNLIPPEGGEDALRHFALALCGEPQVLETVLVTKDGRWLDLSVTGGPILVQGAAVGVFAIATDITERKRAQACLAAFSHLGQKLSSATTQVEAARSLADATVELFGWDAFGLSLCSVEDNWFRPILHSTTLEGQRAEMLPLGLETGIPAGVRRVLTQGPELVLKSDPSAPLPEFVPLDDPTRRSASLMFVPIRWKARSIAVLSVQSCRPQAYTHKDLLILESLAGYCGGALERICAQEAVASLQSDLERRVQERTEQLSAANQELEAFCYSVSHDLRAPLRAISGFTRMLAGTNEDHLDEEGRDCLNRVIQSSREMDRLIEDLLHLSRISRGDMHRQLVDISAMARAIAGNLQAAEPSRSVEISIAPGLTAQGDARLLRIALENLLNNAWKFTGRKQVARIELGRESTKEGPAYFVRDNGAGFEMEYSGKLFMPFQRLHTTAEFPGHGIGLATVQRIVNRHGGRIWGVGQTGHGATFYFTLAA